MQKQQQRKFATHSHNDILQPNNFPHNKVSIINNIKGMP